MEERRRFITVRQLELLTEFLENHKDLALAVSLKEATAMRSSLWAECADIVNIDGSGRTAKEWSEVWNDFKCKVRAKLVTINASRKVTSGGPSTPITLTALEERVANILGRDVGPLPNATKDYFGTNDNIVIEEILEEMPEQESAQSPIRLNRTVADVYLPHTTPVSSPAPSKSGQAPTLCRAVARVRERRRTERALRQPTARANPSRRARTSLEKSRRMVLDIEKLRAQADLKISEATLSFSDSCRLIARSIDRLRDKYCHQ